MIGEAAARQYRTRLLALQARLDREQSQLQDEAQRPIGGEASGGLSDVPIHTADLGTREIDEDITLRLLSNEERLGEEIAAALGRLDGGTFGLCEACGGAIPKGRLSALPYARYCVGCARKARGEAGP